MRKHATVAAELMTIADRTGDYYVSEVELRVWLLPVLLIISRDSGAVLNARQ